MIIRKQLVKRNIAGDVLLVPVGDASLEIKGLLTLNETGERIWDLLPDCADEGEILRIMLSEYDVPEAELKADIAEFLASLKELKII